MRLKKWALAALAGVAGLVGQAAPAAAQAQGGPAAAQGLPPLKAKPAATVNGETITLDDVEAALQMRGPLPVELPAARRQQLRFQVLNAMIDGKLMGQFLDQQGPPIDEAEVSKCVGDLEVAAKRSGKSLADILKEAHQDQRQLRQGIKHNLQWEAYARAHLSDGDVKRYYDENKDFFDGVTVRASHILLRVPPKAPDAERQAARQKLQAVRQGIVSGQIDFAAAAKKYSQCESADKGGDIGPFPRKTVVDENFAKAAFALPVGEVSDVVTTDYGLHLIKVTERKPGAQPSEFEKIKDVVRDFCVAEMYANVVAQQRERSKVEVLLTP
jgi:peptidyl-prolyl cis-trans isomerase C